MVTVLEKQVQYDKAKKMNVCGSELFFQYLYVDIYKYVRLANR